MVLHDYGAGVPSDTTGHQGTLSSSESVLDSRTMLDTSASFTTIDIPTTPRSVENSSSPEILQRGNERALVGQGILRATIKGVSNGGGIGTTVLHTLNPFIGAYIIQLPFFLKFLDIRLNGFGSKFESLLGWVALAIVGVTEWFQRVVDEYSWAVSGVSAVMMLILALWLPFALQRLIMFGARRRSLWRALFFNIFYYTLLFSLSLLAMVWDFGITVTFEHGFVVEEASFYVFLVTLYAFLPSIVAIVAFPVDIMGGGAWIFLRAFAGRLKRAAITQYNIFKNLFLPKELGLWRYAINIPLYVLCAFNFIIILIVVEIAAIVHMLILSVPIVFGAFPTGRKKLIFTTRSGLGVVGTVRLWQYPCLISLPLAIFAKLLHFRLLYLPYIVFVFFFAYAFVLEVHHVALVAHVDRREVGAITSFQNDETVRLGTESAVRSLLWSVMPGGSIVTLLSRWLTAPPLRYRSESPLCGVKYNTRAWMFAFCSASCYLAGFFLIDSSLWFMVGFLLLMFFSRFIYFRRDAEDSVQVLDYDVAIDHAETLDLAMKSPRRQRKIVRAHNEAFCQEYYKRFVNSFSVPEFTFISPEDPVNISKIHADIVTVSIEMKMSRNHSFFKELCREWYIKTDKTSAKTICAFLCGHEPDATNFSQYLLQMAGIADVSVDYVFSYLAMLLSTEKLSSETVLTMADFSKRVIETSSSHIMMGEHHGIPAALLSDNTYILAGFVIGHVMNRLDIENCWDIEFRTAVERDLSVLKILRAYQGDVNPMLGLRLGWRNFIGNINKLTMEFPNMREIIIKDHENVMVGCGCLLYHWSLVVGISKKLTVPFVSVPAYYFTRNTCVDRMVSSSATQWDVAARGYLNAVYLCNEVLKTGYFSEYTTRALLLRVITPGSFVGYAAPAIVLLYLKQDLYTDVSDFDARMKFSGIGQWILRNYVDSTPHGTFLHPTVCLSTSRLAGYLVEGTDDISSLRTASENMLWTPRADELDPTASALTDHMDDMISCIALGQSNARMPTLAEKK
ncbi:hypothetical protein PCE1_004653 [Barthelona sp. PCE]